MSLLLHAYLYIYIWGRGSCFINQMCTQFYPQNVRVISVCGNTSSFTLKTQQVMPQSWSTTIHGHSFYAAGRRLLGVCFELGLQGISHCFGTDLCVCSGLTIWYWITNHCSLLWEDRTDFFTLSIPWLPVALCVELNQILHPLDNSLRVLVINGKQESHQIELRWHLSMRRFWIWCPRPLFSHKPFLFTVWGSSGTRPLQ